MLRIIRVVGLIALLVAASAPATTAQEPTVDATDLEASCRANAGDEVMLATCLYVVHAVLAPGSGVDGAALLDPSAEAGVGDTQETETLQITLLDFAWDVEEIYQPPEDHVVVAAYLRLVGLAESAKLGTINVTVSGPDGIARGKTYSCPEPCLAVAELEPGQAQEGWMAFEVPEDTDWLKLGYREYGGSDRLHWFVAR